MTRRIVIATGGTGGHIFPAISLTNHLKNYDYVIAVISEEYGSIASIIILIIFLYISFRIIKNCFNQENQFLKISLSGLASLLIFQTFIHAGVNTNLLPTTGMTLPFLSYGGSSLIGSAILAGLVLNYTKNKAYLYD